jgi:hypothetical protein
VSRVVPGVCRYCGCTENTACRVAPYGPEDTCGWLPDSMRTACSAKPCWFAWSRHQKRAKEQQEARAARRFERSLLR